MVNDGLDGGVSFEHLLVVTAALHGGTGLNGLAHFQVDLVLFSGLLVNIEII